MLSQPFFMIALTQKHHPPALLHAGHGGNPPSLRRRLSTGGSLRELRGPVRLRPSGATGELTSASETPALSPWTIRSDGDTDRRLG